MTPDTDISAIYDSKESFNLFMLHCVLGNKGQNLSIAQNSKPST